MRTDAVAKRLERETRLARERINSRFLEATESKAIVFELDLWLGVNFSQFNDADDRIERILRSELNGEQFATLPARPEFGAGVTSSGAKKQSSIKSPRHVPRRTPSPKGH